MAHWQESKLTLMERVAHILQTGALADVEFLVGSEENMKRVPAHKLILSMGSPVFAAMFQIRFEESKPITLPDIMPSTFFKILLYLYTDNLSVGENMHEVLELYYAAEKYMIPKLTDECKMHLQSLQLYPETVCHIFETARILGIQTLEERCVTFISSSTTDVLRSAEFITAKQETVQMILEMNEVSVVSEVEFFSALMTWGRAECNRRNLKASVVNLKAIVEPLIPYIRFLTMSIEEFTKAVNDAEDIIDCEDTLAIYMRIANLSTKRFKNLPSWCNTAGSRCLISSDLGSRCLISSDIVLDINLLNFHSSYDPYGLRAQSERSFISVLQLESFNNNLVIKGVKLMWLGPNEQEDDSMCNNRMSTLWYKLKALNQTTGVKVNMESIVTSEKEISLIFPNFVPVACSEKVFIEVSVDAYKFKFLQCINEANRYKTADFDITLLRSNSLSKDFVIKGLIYFFTK